MIHRLCIDSLWRSPRSPMKEPKESQSRRLRLVWKTNIHTTDTKLFDRTTRSLKVFLRHMYYILYATKIVSHNSNSVHFSPVWDFLFSKQRCHYFPTIISDILFFPRHFLFDEKNVNMRNSPGILRRSRLGNERRSNDGVRAQSEGGHVQQRRSFFFRRRACAAAIFFTCTL